MLESFGIRSDRTDEIVQLPKADPVLRGEVMDHLLGMLDALPEIRVRVSSRAAAEVDIVGVPSHGEAFCLIVPLLETCLDDDFRPLSSPLIAQVGFIAMLPAIPETIALQLAFGRGAGTAQIREMARLIARATRRSLSVDEYVAELAAEDAVPRTALVRLFHGETRRVPDEERMAKGVTLLRTTASLVPLPFRPPLLCAIAWLQWARGKRAIAQAYLAEASRIEPEHVLAYGLNWLVAAKTPAWIRHLPYRDDFFHV